MLYAQNGATDEELRCNEHRQNIRVSGKETQPAVYLDLGTVAGARVPRMTGRSSLELAGDVIGRSGEVLGAWEEEAGERPELLGRAAARGSRTPAAGAAGSGCR